MEYELINWLTSLVTELAKFGTWLTSPLPQINIAPLYLFGFTGLTIIIGALLLRLFVGG